MSRFVIVRHDNNVNMSTFREVCVNVSFYPGVFHVAGAFVFILPLIYELKSLFGHISSV